MTPVVAAQETADAGFLRHPLSAAPDLAALHQARPDRYPHLLESVAHGTERGRFDILFAFPGSTLALQAQAGLHLDGKATGEADFLAAFDRLWRAEASATSGEARNPPFRGGWFVFLAYELAAQIEPRLRRSVTDPDMPIALATRFPAAIVYDHWHGSAALVCEAERAELLPLMQQDAMRPATVAPAQIRVARLTEDDAEEFLAGVERVKAYIEAGDVFQVNLSRGWHVTLAENVDAVSLYHKLRQTNPSPFSGLATWPDGRAVISSSPERLVEVRGRTVSTRPIAGTYPRSADPREDQTWSRELLAHPKERAEHVMLIDLERNDLGRVCRPGTVRVSELMGLESYRHVHHIVSEVTGELRPDVGPAQVIGAVFPGGTITGCPKVRCMEIVAELERTPRGAYTGSMGYVNRDGSMDLNILIRTLSKVGDTLRLRAGAGIVADSVPERELNETRAKAKGLLAALELA